MYRLGVVLLLVFGLCECDEQFRKLADAEWHCDYICIGSGGSADYNPNTNVCVCRLPDNIDEADIELMFKNARNVDLNLLAFVPTSNKIIKRSAPNPDGIVGQSFQLSTARPRPRLTPFTFTTRRPRPSTLFPLRTTTQRSLLRTTRTQLNRSNTEQQRRIQEIQDRLNRMREERRNRARPQMNQRASFGTTTTEQRSVLDQIRERQQQRRINREPQHLGVQQASTEKAAEQETNVNVIDSDNQPQITIITQSPDLIDGDN